MTTSPPEEESTLQIVAGMVGLWLGGVVAGFGGLALVLAGFAMTEVPAWWRALAVAVGVAAAVAAATVQFSQTYGPRRIGALAVGAIAVPVVFALPRLLGLA